MKQIFVIKIIGPAVFGAFGEEIQTSSYFHIGFKNIRYGVKVIKEATQFSTYTEAETVINNLTDVPAGYFLSIEKHYVKS